MMEIRFQIPASVKYLSLLRQLVQSLKLSPETKLKCRTALVEAVDNAIFHASGRNGRKTIGVRLKAGRGDILMEVKDEGCGFDVRKIPEPDFCKTGGRGIFIIKALMDEVSYKNNVLKMRCRSEKSKRA